MPASLLSQAPWSDEVLTTLWGGGCGHPYCPVASVAGVTYFDGGFPLVIVGSFAFGFGLRWLATRWVYDRHLGDFPATAVAIATASPWWLPHEHRPRGLVVHLHADHRMAHSPRVLPSG